MPIALSELISLDKAATLLKIHKMTLLRAIRAGHLEAVKLGKTYRVTEQGLQDYINTLTVNRRDTQ